MNDKPSWDEYFLALASTASIRSSCQRSKVGAVVVKDRRVVSVGYNDSPAGEPGCESCPRRVSGCAPGSDYNTGATRCVSIHAEGNALIHGNRADVVGSTIYVTRSCCHDCRKLVKAAGVVRVVTPEGEEIL